MKQLLTFILDPRKCHPQSLLPSPSGKACPHPLRLPASDASTPSSPQSPSGPPPLQNAAHNPQTPHPANPDPANTSPTHPGKHASGLARVRLCVCAKITRGMFLVSGMLCGVAPQTVTREMLAGKFALILPHLDERQRRLLLGTEARALGHGGIRLVAQAAGVREATVSLGIDELQVASRWAVRACRAGGAGGRPTPTRGWSRHCWHWWSW